MIAKHYSRDVGQHVLRESISVNKDGATLLGISQVAESIGFQTIGAKITFDTLKHDTVLPCICYWNQVHFVVVYRIKGDKVYVADPAHGLLTYKKTDFLRCWVSTYSNEVAAGIVLILKPGSAFYASPKICGVKAKPRNNFLEVGQYLKPHRRLVALLIAGLLMGGIIQWTLPIFTQYIVDIGISDRSMPFIMMVLAGQLVIQVSMFCNTFIQQLIAIHLGTRINISAISGFLTKIFSLPLSFFETRMVGDLLRRIEDHYRVEQFLTTTLFNSLLSLTTLVASVTILLLYDVFICLTLVGFSGIYVAYVLLFLRKRREIDYKRFQQLALNESSLIQFIHGITEIKLNNCETFKKWEWEKIQAKLFKSNLVSLKLSQYQAAGGHLINSIKNCVITAMTAFAVINGEMTLGIMMAVQFIIGQVNEFVSLVQRWQDAKIATERINEVKAIDSQEGPSASTAMPGGSRGISFEDVSFSYGPHAGLALDRISLEIPKNKVTAVVGHSGSGKTTLIKLLLKFYPPSMGKIVVGGSDLSEISTFDWRRSCGVVMQDGYIFGDTIARNIALSDEVVDYDRVYRAAKDASIHDFISALPLNYSSNLGSGGIGLSQGQKQRILIARALYKSPPFIMFDEATSCLDANTERSIIQNFKEVFSGRTVIIIAHRLSTVKSADQIVVMDRGSVCEIGNHAELIKLQGHYYALVQNQLV